MQQNGRPNTQQFKYNQQNQQPFRNSWIYRYPRVFVTVTTTTALCIFFSRPIYDIFFRKDIPDYKELLKHHKSRFHS